MTGSRRDLWIAAHPYCLLAGFCLFWFSDTVADPDLWGHVRFGQDILRTGVIAQADDYSYRSEGQRWVNHEWLSEVIFAGVYDRSGPKGLIVLKVLVSLLILGLCLVHLRRGGLGPWRSVPLLVLASIPFRMGLGTVRPQIFTYLFLLMELLILAGTGPGRERGLWVLPILIAIWANLHGGVLAGLAILGLWIMLRIVGHLRDETQPPFRRNGAILRLGLLGISGCLALLVNPYQAELPRFLLRTATVPRPEILEWAPLGLTSLPGLLYLALLAIGIFGLAGSRLPRGEVIPILGVSAVLPLVSNRHYPLFALTLIVLGGRHIADASDRRGPSTGARLAGSRMVAATGLAVALLLLGLSLPRFGCIRVDPYFFPFPARAVALLKQSDARGNMAVPFDWGEYVLWHLGRRVKVSMDGRRETVYSDESYRQSCDFERGTGNWDALLKTGPRTDLVLAPIGSPTANLLGRADDWLPLYRDTVCVLFVRPGFRDLDRIVRGPVPSLPDHGGGLCFPEPDRTRRNVASEKDVALGASCPCQAPGDRKW
ncbi:MAG: hypothetical protein NVSMB9_11620 [Isosphaeraceae bacterium]